MYILLFTVPYIGFIACHSTSHSEKKPEKHSDKARSINVKDYGAVGNGTTDDTQNIQAAINAASRTKDTVIIPSGIYKVKTLVLRSGTKLKSTGLLRQYLPADTQFYGTSRQNSSSPLFFGKNLDEVWLSFHAETLNEGIYIYNSKRITITNTTLKGNPKKVRSFSGILLYNSEEISITQSAVAFYGASRNSAKTYQPGTAIRLLSCQKINIQRNYIHHNGENGIFLHASGYASIKRNLITHNGMSGIQIGFGKTKAEKNFVISYNQLHENAADAIDINNRASPDPLVINCIIEHNHSEHNGFVRDSSTVDGSGIATLIGVSKVRLYRNNSSRSNRPAVYLERCDDIHVARNNSDQKMEIVGGFGHLEFLNNKFDAITVLAHTTGRKITLKYNNMRTVLLPNDIQIDSLILHKNQLENAGLNLNFKGYFSFDDNILQSHDPNGALLLINVKKASIRQNKIHNNTSYGIVVQKQAQQVNITDNTIEAVNACLSDEGAENLTITGNELVALPGGRTQRTLISRNPKNLRLSQNSHYGGKSDNSIKFEGTGTAFIEREDIKSGYPDYGKVIVKSF